MVFGGVVVGFARILVAEGVPLIVAGMVDFRSKILPPHVAASLFFIHQTPMITAEASKQASCTL